MTTFWTTLATYCSELAPVTGPLLNALGETASAIERADRSTSSLKDASPRHSLPYHDA